MGACKGECHPADCSEEGDKQSAAPERPVSSRGYLFQIPFPFPFYTIGGGKSFWVALQGVRGGRLTRVAVARGAAGVLDLRASGVLASEGKRGRGEAEGRRWWRGAGGVSRR